MAIGRALVLAGELMLAGSCGGSAELTAEAFNAETTNEQSFFAIAEHLLGPCCEAAIDQLELGLCYIRGVDVEAGANVIPTAGLPVGVKFAEHAWMVAH